MSKRAAIERDEEAEGLLSGSLALVDRHLRVGLALSEDEDVRLTMLAGLPALGVELPVESGWAVVTRAGLRLQRDKPNGIEIAGTERLYSTPSNQSKGRVEEARALRAEKLLREGLLAGSRSAFRELEAWAPLIESYVYAFATRLVQNLDRMRQEVRSGKRPQDETFARHYYEFVAMLGRATLQSSGPGAGSWLASMALSFDWVTWTPSFPLVRDRSLWASMIGARTAAETGPAVIDRYASSLSRARHSTNGIDAVLGLTAIAMRHPSVDEDVRTVLQHERARLDDRRVIAPGMLHLAFAQAERLLDGRLPQMGTPSLQFDVDPLNADGPGGISAFAALEYALGAPSWKFVQGATTGATIRPPSAGRCLTMFGRAWGPAGAETSPRIVLH